MIDFSKDYRLTVIADSNDGDYVTVINKISGEDIKKQVLPVINEINRVNANYNWYTMEGRPEPTPENLYNLTEDQIEWFDECVMPSIESGTHSIKEISITEWVEQVQLYP
jgi:predicted GTPase